ncbi:MAG: ATP-binding protein [Luteitalea sp.]|nr:ATP-binding protein [Luteitalea sp.]
MRKPDILWNRDAEWTDLATVATDPRPGATLALLYGRRRQGKTLMLELLTEATGGFMFTGLQQSATQQLAGLGEAYARFRRLPTRSAFADWRTAIDALLALGDGVKAPVPVVLDEFGYLLEASRELASVIQNGLSPRGTARRRGRTRLILCGSALTTMRSLLTGSAPLRGRASAEIMLNPLDYRAAAGLWGLAGQPALAFRVHALLGGTPAYPEMAGAAPTTLAAFDRWVQQRLLHPSSALFREGNVLLQEEPEITDRLTCHAVLAALSQGRTRRGEIAAALGRPDSSLTHPLVALEQVQLVEKVEDAFRQKRSIYRIREPIIRTHQLILRPNEARLVARASARVWADARETVVSLIYGPHLEDLARIWCMHHAAEATVGGVATKVRPAVLACRDHRRGHQLDLVVTDGRPGKGERIIAIGEAKAHGRALAIEELKRLDHLRALLPPSQVTVPPRLILVSTAGVARDLRAEAQRRGDVELVDLDRLYAGQ